MALDFGMALARGLVAHDKDYQTTVKKAAGGGGVFKSEDWWSSQLDKAIKGKFTKTTQEAKRPIGFEARGGARDHSIISAKPVYGQRVGRNRPIQHWEVVRDVTKQALAGILKQSKQTTERVKSKSAKVKASRRRLSRATGGLLSKTRIPGTDGMSTGLPDLGAGGLGIVGSILGSKAKV